MLKSLEEPMTATIDLTNTIFHDEAKARAYLEAQRWPDGVTCPFCGGLDDVKPLNSEHHGAGWYHCNDCRKLFTVRVRSVMERSHIPLPKWALAFHLMAASKKGVSAKQVERMLGVTYKTAWFMCHRIREAMTMPGAGPIGGHGKTVESDETFVGGKKKNVHKGKPEPRKHAVHALVERGGQMRATHVADVSAKTLRKAIAKHVAKGTTMNTDDALAYYHMSKEFAGHGVVNHSKDEYVSKDGKVHIQSAEAFFAILKRGVMGSFHSISEQHLQRYVDEFAFRWNTRSALGVEDTERASRAIKGAAGKRLTYRGTDKGAERRANDA
jgi:transposase-like protein